MRAARIDTTHRDIADMFVAHGWSVESLASVGKGCPDLLVYHRGTDRLALVECKSGKARTKRETRERQSAFAARFRVARCVSAEDARIQIETGAI